jgi:hypothetical protein
VRRQDRDERAGGFSADGHSQRTGSVDRLKPPVAAD